MPKSDFLEILESASRELDTIYQGEMDIVQKKCTFSVKNFFSYLMLRNCSESLPMPIADTWHAAAVPTTPPEL